MKSYTVTAASVEDMSYVADRLGEHMALTPEGYLLVKDCVIARTAMRVAQKYRGAEIHDELPAGQVFSVWRSPDQVFHPYAMASAEGKPLVSPHPPKFLDPTNANWYAKGHIQNVRMGPMLDDGEYGLIADVLITDSALIDQVRSGGLRNVSLGYACEYTPRQDGTFEQSKIRVNHCAIVPRGRAGDEVSIMDSGEGVMDFETAKVLLKQVQDFTKTLRGEAESIEAGAKLTERLTLEGVSVGVMHDTLMKHSEAYRVREAQQKTAQDFSDAVKKAGREMGARQLSCTATIAPVAQHAEEDYGEMCARIGRKLRGEK